MFYIGLMAAEMIGARELGQNVSRVLREVEESGERIITVRGRPVARLSPIENAMAARLAAADLQPTPRTPVELSIPQFDVLIETTEDSNRYELIQGVLVVSPPPDRRHQTILGRLFTMLDSALPMTGCVQMGVGVRTSGDSHLIPDLSVFPTDDDSGIFSAVLPRLVVEITSGNRRTDLVDKRQAYADLGVEAYWVVDRRTRQLLVFTLHPETQTYPAATKYGSGVHTITTPMGPVTVDVDDLLGPPQPEDSGPA